MVWEKCRPHGGLSTGLRHVELTWGHFLSVPGPIATKRYLRAAIPLGHEPQRAGRGHDQTKRVGAYDALALATLILPETIEGIGVTNFNFDGPALAILVHDVLAAQGEIGCEKGLDRRRWFSWPRWVVARLPRVVRPRPACGARATPRATGPPRLGARRRPHWGEASNPWRFAPGSWASRSGRLFCVGHRDALGAGVVATRRAWR